MDFGVPSIKEKLLFFLNGCKGFLLRRRLISTKHAVIMAPIRRVRRYLGYVGYRYLTAAPQPNQQSDENKGEVVGANGFEPC